VALVLRSAVLGQPHSEQRAIGTAQVPRIDAFQGRPDQDPLAVGVATVVGRAKDHADDAAAVPTPPASVMAILVAVVVIASGTAIGYAISTAAHVDPFRVTDQMAIFGMLIIFAAAVERILEPFTQRLPGRRARAEYELSVARLANRDPGITVADVARAKARVDRARADRVVIVWGVATAIATIVCAGTGFFVLRALANEPDWDGVATWIDALVTGLIVGSGTKPVHDIVSRLQKSKEKAEDTP
jgi:hypothetical protein